MKTIFVIDWVLIPLFVLTAVTGIGLHVAGCGSHEVWHGRAVAHVVASILFTASVIAHVVTHRGWYKVVLQRGPGRRGRVTAAVSVVFVVVAATGFVLLGVDGGGSPVGLWHYRNGLAAVAIMSGHVVRRLPRLTRRG